jgi:hypothetical protein
MRGPRRRVSPRGGTWHPQAQRIVQRLELRRGLVTEAVTWQARGMFKGLKQFLGRARGWLTWPVVSLLQSQHDFLLRAQWERELRAAKNPLNRFGAKCFSQTDEDGITLEIVKRLGIRAGTFAELGVGNGLENNTLVLLASGWRGFWIGGEDLAFNHTLNPKRFEFFKAKVTLENVAGLMKQGSKSIAINELDVLSVDLDGNDFYIAGELLKGGVLPNFLYWNTMQNFRHPLNGLSNTIPVTHGISQIITALL